MPYCINFPPENDKKFIFINFVLYKYFQQNFDDTNTIYNYIIKELHHQVLYAG